MKSESKKGGKEAMEELSGLVPVIQLSDLYSLQRPREGLGGGLGGQIAFCPHPKELPVTAEPPLKRLTVCCWRSGSVRHQPGG